MEGMLYPAWIPALGFVGSNGVAATKVGTVSLVATNGGVASSHSDSGTNLVRLSLANSNIGTSGSGASIVVVFLLPESYAGADKRIVALGSEQGSAGNTLFSIGTGNTSTNLKFTVVGDSGNIFSFESSGTSFNDGRLHCAVLSARNFSAGSNGQVSAAVDGRVLFSDTSTSPLGVGSLFSSLVVGGFRRGGTDSAGATCKVIAAAVLPSLPTPAVARLSGDPRSLFFPDELFAWVPDASAAAALAGGATGQAAASGSLTTQILLDAAAAVIETASGSLTTAITLAGSAASVTVSSGVLTANIKLSGDALAQVLASASLSGGSAALAGVANAAASASGQITTNVSLSGAALAQALASAGLTTVPSGLSGAASISASSSGALSTSIAVVGQASALAIATGGLSTGIRLTGSAASVSAATGNLTITTGLSAAAFAQAAVAGTLSTQIRLDAAAVAQALASAGLSTGGSVDPFDDPRYTLRFAARNSTLTARARNWGVSIQ